MTTTYLPDAPLHQIRVHGNNPRRDLGDLTELTASITAKGILEPLVLAPINGVEWLLIAGHRRHAAAKAAGLTTAPALVHDDLDTPTKQLEAMLIENTQRTDLTPVEEAQAYQALLDFGSTIPKVAKATGRAVKTVKGRLALTKLPETTLTRIHNGQISLEDANTLTEFAGTPEYKTLVRDVGTSQFKYTVERIRAARKAAEVADVVKAHATEQGWPTVTSWLQAGDKVIDQYPTKTVANVTKALADLVGPHVLLLTNYGSWSVCTPRTEQDDDAPTDTSGSTAAAWDNSEAARAEREHRRAEAEIARTVRVNFLTGRLEHLILTPAERLALLRLLLTRRLEDGDYVNADLALGGLPTKADGTERTWSDPTDDLTTHVADINENHSRSPGRSGHASATKGTAMSDFTEDQRVRALELACGLAANGRIDATDVVPTAKEFFDFLFV